MTENQINKKILNKAKETDKVKITRLQKGTVDLPEIIISYTELLLNNYNGRINDYRDLVNSKHWDSNEIQTKIQEKIYSFSKNKEDRMNDLVENGIQENLVIDLSGRIISGNHRFTLVKEIYKRDNHIGKNLRELKVSVIMKVLSKKEAIAEEGATNHASNWKQEYDTLNRFISAYEYYLENKKIVREKDLKEIKGLSSDEIQVYIEIVELYYKFLRYIGSPERTEFHRSKATYYLLMELKSALKSSKLEKTKIDLTKIAFELLLSTNTSQNDLIKLFKEVRLSLDKSFNDSSEYILNELQKGVFNKISNKVKKEISANGFIPIPLLKEIKLKNKKQKWLITNTIERAKEERLKYTNSSMIVTEEFTILKRQTINILRKYKKNFGKMSSDQMDEIDRDSKEIIKELYEGVVKR